MFTTDSNENRKSVRPDDSNKNGKAFKSQYSERKDSFRNKYSLYEDEDDYGTQHRSRKAHDSKGRGFDSEDIELPDKLESMKRFEREKKAVMKKYREEEIERRKKPVIKQKRSTKDWTRDYNYGLLDEEVFM